MASNNIVELAVADLEARLQSVAPLAGKVLFVSNEEEFIDKLKAGAVPPAAAIVYEGMRTTDTDQRGAASEMVVLICLVNRPSTLINADTKLASLALLGEVRGKIKGTRSPTGHFWKFLVEAPVKVNNGVSFWVQRWSCPVQL